MTHSEFCFMLQKDKSGAQQALFNEYLNYVYAIVYDRLRRCGSREDISECVIDVFMEVFSSYEPQADLSGDIKGFIGTVAYRKALDYFRRLCRKGVSLSLDDDKNETVSSDENITEMTEQNELREILLDLIERLGRPDSVIIMEKFFYGRNSLEISRLVHLSPITVRVRCSRALKKLRKLLADNDITI